MNEKVLCYKLPKFSNDLDREAFVSSLLSSLIEDYQFSRTHLTMETDVTGFTFEPRGKVETDENFVQVNYQKAFVKLIDGKVHLFVLNKLQGSTETRLHGRYDAFVGGHTNETDKHNEKDTILDILRNNQQRECEEEVSITGHQQYVLTSKIYTTSESVSRFHGCLFDIILLEDNGTIEIKEPDKLLGEFIPVDELLQQPEALNSWASICVDFLQQADVQTKILEHYSSVDK